MIGKSRKLAVASLGTIFFCALALGLVVPDGFARADSSALLNSLQSASQRISSSVSGERASLPTDIVNQANGLLQQISQAVSLLQGSAGTGAAACGSGSTLLGSLQSSEQCVQSALTAGQGSLPAGVVSDTNSLLNSIQQTIQAMGFGSAASQSTAAGANGNSGAFGAGTGTAAPAPVTLLVSGSRTGSFAVGQAWTLTMSGAPANAPFLMCAIVNGVQSCTPNWGTTDANGNWTSSGSFAATEAGSWREWAIFSSGSVSNLIIFSVNAAGSSGSTSGIGSGSGSAGTGGGAGAGGGISGTGSGSTSGTGGGTAPNPPAGGGTPPPTGTPGSGGATPPAGGGVEGSGNSGGNSGNPIVPIFPPTNTGSGTGRGGGRVGPAPVRPIPRPSSGSGASGAGTSGTTSGGGTSGTGGSGGGGNGGGGGVGIISGGGGAGGGVFGGFGGSGTTSGSGGSTGSGTGTTGTTGTSGTGTSGTGSGNSGTSGTSGSHSTCETNGEGVEVCSCDAGYHPALDPVTQLFECLPDAATPPSTGSVSCQPEAVQSCDSKPNACGLTNSGSETCSADATWGTCSATVRPDDECPAFCAENPEDPDCGAFTGNHGTGSVCRPGDSKACTSPANACGRTADGTETCGSNGAWESCSGVTPSDSICSSVCSLHPDEGSCSQYLVCQNDPNALGCSRGICTPGTEEDCSSSANACGLIDIGTRTCASDGKSWGSCSARTPSSQDCSIYCAQNPDDEDCKVFSDNCATNPSAPGCTCSPGAQEDCASEPNACGMQDGGKQTCASDGKSWGACSAMTVPDNACPATGSSGTSGSSGSGGGGGAGPTCKDDPGNSDCFSYCEENPEDEACVEESVGAVLTGGAASTQGDTNSNFADFWDLFD